MSDVTEQLRKSLHKQRREMLNLLSTELHPTASSILDEGAKVITSGGGGALTMRAVAKQANIKLASLQYHFKTFDHLISTLFSREFRFVAEILWSTLEKVESRQDSPATALRTAVETFMPDDDHPPRTPHKIYFHLLAFCSYNEEAFVKAKAFYKFYNTLIAYLISRCNPALSAAECIARAIMIVSTLEGSGVYTILKVGGAPGEKTIHREIGALALSYAALPSESPLKVQFAEAVS
jgi:AcrR family transcriptional regulator